MKIIERNYFSREDFLNRMKGNAIFLDEEGEKGIKESTVYINSEGQYVIGKEKSNFVFLSIDASKVYGKEENQIDDILIDIELLMLRREEIITLQLCREEFNNEKWIAKIISPISLRISKRGYQKIIDAININETERIYFQDIGIHQVKGKQYYATSNCAITSEGINGNIKALQEGFNFEYDENVSEDYAIEKFMEYTNQNINIYFPIHCVSILAVIRNYLKEKEISAGAVLWIDGPIASGKTQLAMYTGDFFNRGNTWDYLIQNIHSPKNRTSNTIQQLKECQNAVFILDDIKKEETVRNRENAKNNTDLIIRAIYMGKIGDEQEDNIINATGIITGEFFKEQTSTISRLLYMNIGSFLLEKENGENFAKLQENKKYLANFMRYFIRWILEKKEVNKYFACLLKKYKNLKKELAETFINQISTRIIEITATFQLVTIVLKDYFEERSSFDEKKINEFEVESKQIISDLGKNTLYKSLNYRPLMVEAFSYALDSLNIKDCRYGNSFLYYIHNRNNKAYKGNEKEIEEEQGNIELLNANDIYEEKTCLMGFELEGLIYTNSKNIEILLVNKNVLVNTMQTRIKEYAKRGNISIYETDIEEERILTELSYAHCIRTHKRNDGFDKVLKYPFYEKENYEGADQIAYKESVTVVSVDSSYMDCIKKYSKQTIEYWYQDCKYIREHDWGMRFYDSENEKVDKAISKANKFLDLR